MALQTIILLTGPVEQPVLSKVLLGHNPGLTIRPIETLAELSAFAPELLSQARLIAFTSPIIVPINVLDLLGFGAYNFHPASPDFPGWAPAHFAVYHQATQFGATAHVMTERVDAGPIVDVELFSISRDIRSASCKSWPIPRSLACSGGRRKFYRRNPSLSPNCQSAGAARRRPEIVTPRCAMSPPTFPVTSGRAASKRSGTRKHWLTHSNRMERLGKLR